MSRPNRDSHDKIKKNLLYSLYSEHSIDQINTYTLVKSHNLFFVAVRCYQTDKGGSAAADNSVTKNPYNLYLLIVIYKKLD